MVARTVVLLASLGCLAGCVGAGPDFDDGAATASQPSTTPPGSSCCKNIDPGAPNAISVTGEIRNGAGAGVGNVEVLRISADPYLQPILRAQSAPDGSFVLDGVAPETRQWLLFQAPGYPELLQAFETTADAHMALPVVTLLADAEASALAGLYGVELDPSRCSIRVPVTTMIDGKAVPLSAGDFQVDLSRALDAPVYVIDGEIVVFNAAASDNSVQLTVTRAGQKCVPAVHPTPAEKDGSVTIPTAAGDWIVGPTMVCQ
jgi:hypothetical protein